MISKTQSVGIFLDQYTLWAVCVEVPMMGGQPILKTSFKYDLLSIPEELTSRMYFFSEIIKLAISKLDVSSGSIGMVFADADTLVRYFEMPIIPDTDMRTAVYFEAQKFMPFPMKDLYFNFKSFPRPEIKKQGVVFTAAKKEELDTWKQAMTHAGYILDFVEPEGMAFFRLMATADEQFSSAKVKIYAGLRSSGSLTFIVARGEEVLMSNTAKIPPPIAIAGEKAKKMDSESVGRQISLLLSYFLKNFRGQKVSELLITSDPGYAEEGLASALSARLGFPARAVPLAKLFAGLSKTEVSYAHMIALAAGKARVRPLFSLGSEKSMNLLSASVSKKSLFSKTSLSWTQEVKELRRLATLEILMLTVIFVFFHLFFLGKINSAKNNLAQIKTESAATAVPAEVLSAADVDAATLALSRKADFLTSIYSKRVYWTHKLSEITRLAPEGVALDMLEIDDSQGKSNKLIRSLRLEGHTSNLGDDITTVNQFVEGLKSSPTLTSGIGAVKMSKLRKTVDDDGKYSSSAFLIESEMAEEPA